MTATATIAENLKTRVSGTFPATGFAAGVSPEQIAAGRSIPPGLMPPCVLILAGDGAVEDSTLTRRQRFQLVLIDLLKGRGDARAASAWTQFDALQALFPQDGVEVGGGFRLYGRNDDRFVINPSYSLLRQRRNSSCRMAEE